jgi:hypothetical protein
MANKEHLAILTQGVEVWNQWRKETERIPDLQGADLSFAALNNANFRGANLYGVDLRSGNLVHANFRDANLSTANLSYAKLVGADLTGADLETAAAGNAKLTNANLSNADLTNATFRNADFSNANLNLTDLMYADLSRANLSGAQLELASLFRTDLRGAKFKNAIVAYTRFADCDLSEAQELAFIKHKGPSTIGIDTIYNSKGNIPDSFLRECGVPEGFITDMGSLVDAVGGIEFYSCFIAYSGKDEGFARRLHGKMYDAQLRVWFAPEDVMGGKKLHEQIETAIRLYDKLLIVLSEASLQSEWVMTELRRAFKAEKQSKTRKLFPVRLVEFDTLRNWECFDADSGKDLAVELREYFIPDFSNWKDHDQFEAAFARLLKDLRAEERPK